MNFKWRKEKERRKKTIENVWWMKRILNGMNMWIGIGNVWKMPEKKNVQRKQNRKTKKISGKCWNDNTEWNSIEGYRFCLVLFKHWKDMFHFSFKKLKVNWFLEWDQSTFISFNSYITLFWFKSYNNSETQKNHFCKSQVFSMHLNIIIILKFTFQINSLKKIKQIDSFWFFFFSHREFVPFQSVFLFWFQTMIIGFKLIQLFKLNAIDSIFF